MLVLVPVPGAAAEALLLFGGWCGAGDVAGCFCPEAGAGDLGAEEDVPWAGSAALAGEARWRLLAAGDPDTGVDGAAEGPVARVGVARVERVGAAVSS